MVLKKKRITRRFLINLIFLIFLLVFPLFNSSYQTDIMAKCISFVIFALSIDLLWGYTGILSLGQAVYFGIGAYIAAISSNVSVGIPNYMTTYGMTEIPLIFRPLMNPIAGIILAILVPALLAFLVGKLLLSGNVKGVFISLITMAIANMVQLYVNNSQKYTGGSNGISNITRPKLFGEIMTIEQNYYFIVLIAVFVFAFCVFLTRSKFGHVLNAIKTNENRMEFIGYHVIDYKVFIYVVSSALAALAGILFAKTSGMISPSVTGIEMSTLVIIWVAVGGRGNLTGAIAGCLILNGMERFMANIIGDYWELIVGAILLVIVVFLPDGLIGTLLKWKLPKGKTDNRKALTQEL